MKAYPVVWNNPVKYKNHIIFIGTFHLICAYLKAIGKKMEGTGFADILIEAGLIGNFSLKGVISGKQYERCLHCHKIVLESLERMLLDRCLEMNETTLDLPQHSKEIIKTMIKYPSKYVFSELLAAKTIFQQIEVFKTDI